MVADARDPHAALPAPAESARPRRTRAVRAHRAGAGACHRLPASPIADALGLMPLPASFFALLAGIVTAYIALTQLAKRRYIARHGELL